MFPVRYELNSYILFRRNSVFKELKASVLHVGRLTSTLISFMHRISSCFLVGHFYAGIQHRRFADSAYMYTYWARLSCFIWPLRRGARARVPLNKDIMMQSPCLSVPHTTIWSSKHEKIDVHSLWVMTQGRISYTPLLHSYACNQFISRQRNCSCA
jgi:hypothetical protein